MGSVCGIEQGFGSWRHVSLAMQQQVPNFLTKFGATRLQGAQHLFAFLPQVFLEQVGLGGFADPVDSLECNEQLALLSPRGGALLGGLRRNPRLYA